MCDPEDRDLIEPHDSQNGNPGTGKSFQHLDNLYSGTFACVNIKL